MGRRPEQRVKALGYLRAKAEQARRGGIGALAGLKELARSAGVGYNTMWAAVQECKAGGELQVKPRAGIRVVPDGAGPAEPVVHSAVGELRRERTRAGARLEQDILTGRYASATELPSVKVLCATYGVCAATLRRALGRLEMHGLLVRERRGYRRAAGRVGATGHIVLVARGSEHGNVRTYAPRSMAHFRLVEQECARRGLGLRTLTHYYVGEQCRGSEAVVETVRRDREENSVLGYMLMTASVPDEPLAEDLQHLVHCGKPVAVFDETVATPGLQRRFRGPLVRYYTLPDDPAAGRGVGRYLLELGHRRVAFLSHVGFYRGSAARRQDGLAQAFASAGFADAVHLVELPAADSDWVYNPHDYEPFVRRFLDGSGVVPGPASSGSHQRFVEEAAEMMGERLSRYVRRRRFWAELERALECRGPTVWVCYNDELAQDCLDLAAQHGVAVPGELSLVGFDDSDEASRSGLTSYNFNGAAYVHAMLEHLLNPARRSVYRADSDIVRFDGYVTPRQTTARVSFGH